MPNYNILDVANLCGIRLLRSHGSNYRGVCPFCGSSEGFDITLERGGQKKNVFKCLRVSCQAGGNMYQLYARLNGINEADPDYWKEVDNQIKEKLGMDYQPAPVIDTGEFKGERTAEEKDAVYRAMYSMLSLSDLHKEKLRQRGIPEKYFTQFRSTPIHWEERKRICRKLISSGYSLKGIPGFYLNDFGHWDMNLWEKNAGYFCPAQDENGNIVGFQIRLDQPSKKTKYIWFSSPRKNMGASAKAETAWYGLKRQTKTLIITEGVLKAFVIFLYAPKGCAIAGIPGIMQKTAVKEVLEKAKALGYEKIVEAYDMDKFLPVLCRGDMDTDKCLACECACACFRKQPCKWKQQKRKGLQSSCEFLKQNALHMGFAFEQLVWEMDKDGNWTEKNKGYDDFLVARKGGRYGETDHRV